MAEETEEKEDQDQDQDGGAIEKTLKRGGRRRGAVGEKRTLQNYDMAGLAVLGSLRLSDQSRWVLLFLV